MSMCSVCAFCLYGNQILEYGSMTPERGSWRPPPRSTVLPNALTPGQKAKNRVLISRNEYTWGFEVAESEFEVKI